MQKRERLAKAFALELPDRPPILGGWLSAPTHIQSLTGCSAEEYRTDPIRWGIDAEHVLGSDGLVDVTKPAAGDEYRIMDEETLERRSAYTLEAVIAEIEALPERSAQEAAFDEELAYAAFAAELRAYQAPCADIVWCPAQWKMIPKALWYHEYGYENALMLVALYPEHERRLIEFSAVRGRQIAALFARGVREGLLLPAVFTGEDLCSQQGPMVSPQFLHKEYFPWVEYALEPLLQAGVKVVWHCDGNYRPLLADVLACGVGGLQGFQSECGMDLDWIVKLRTRTGDPLLIFGPLSVTTTLPYGTPQEVQAEVARAMTLCRDQASLVFFTSNTITPDVPLANIRTLWQSVQESRW